MLRHNSSILTLVFFLTGPHGQCALKLDNSQSRRARLYTKSGENIYSSQCYKGIDLMLYRNCLAKKNFKEYGFQRDLLLQ